MIQLLFNVLQLGFFLGTFLAIILAILYCIDYTCMMLGFCISKKSFEEFKNDWYNKN